MIDANLPFSPLPQPQASQQIIFKQPKNFLSFRLVIGGLFSLVVLIGGGTALFLSQQNQEIRQQAAGGGPQYTGTIGDGGLGCPDGYSFVSAGVCQQNSPSQTTSGPTVTTAPTVQTVTTPQTTCQKEGMQWCAASSSCITQSSSCSAPVVAPTVTAAGAETTADLGAAAAAAETAAAQQPSVVGNTTGQGDAGSGGSDSIGSFGSSDNNNSGSFGGGTSSNTGSGNSVIPANNPTGPILTPTSISPPNTPSQSSAPNLGTDKIQTVITTAPTNATFGKNSAPVSNYNALSAAAKSGSGANVGNSISNSPSQGSTPLSALIPQAPTQNSTLTVGDTIGASVVTQPAPPTAPTPLADGTACGGYTGKSCDACASGKTASRGRSTYCAPSPIEPVAPVAAPVDPSVCPSGPNVSSCECSDGSTPSAGGRCMDPTAQVQLVDSNGAFTQTTLSNYLANNTRAEPIVPDFQTSLQNVTNDALVAYYQNKANQGGASYQQTVEETQCLASGGSNCSSDLVTQYLSAYSSACKDDPNSVKCGAFITASGLTAGTVAAAGAAGSVAAGTGVAALGTAAVTGASAAFAAGDTATLAIYIGTPLVLGGIIDDTPVLSDARDIATSVIQAGSDLISKVGDIQTGSINVGPINIGPISAKQVIDAYSQTTFSFSTGATLGEVDNSAKLIDAIGGLNSVNFSPVTSSSKSMGSVFTSVENSNIGVAVDVVGAVNTVTCGQLPVLSDSSTSTLGNAFRAVMSANTYVKVKPGYCN